MHRMLAASDAIDKVIERIALAAGWIFILCTGVVCFDVVSRKFGYQIPGFGSTRLQELEWHLHTAIFSFWLGMAYVRNAHVRIDVALRGAGLRTHAWLEIFGCIAFALPYCLVALYFGVDYAWIAWIKNEASVSASGLPYRFIAKGVLAIGFLLLLSAVFSVLMRSVVFLFGPEALRQRSAFAGVKSRAAE
jgi:TRAP-type mannitol/chloroaromatic compound transport system permease small subunit